MIALDFLLSQLVPVPDRKIHKAFSWSQIEEAVNLDLPCDYKQFMDHFGNGGIFDFLGIASPNDWIVDAKEINAKRMRAFSIMAEYRRNWNTFPLYMPDRATGLLCIGGDSNGGTLCWFVDRQKKHWPIVIFDRESSLMECCYCTFTEFLAQILRQEFTPRSVMDADYWNPTAPGFSVYRRL